jgi:hypothetical protein
MTDNFTRGPQITEAKAISTANQKCCQCEEEIESGATAHNWGLGDVACDHCNAHDAAVQGDQDEPTDEGLAYLDRRDRFHGPWHS